MKQKVALLVGLIFGLACLYGAVGSWIGVARAVGGPRTPGTLVNVQCEYIQGGGGIACDGDFTADDGSRREQNIHVEGPRRSTAGPLRATFVPRIPNGLNGAIQSEDTAYVGHVSLGIVGPVLIAVLLTMLALLFNAAYIFIGAAAVVRRRRAPTW